MNQSLTDNQREWQEKVRVLEQRQKEQLAQKQKEIDELNDQVKDMMFFIETQKRVENDDELKNAQIVGVQAPPSPSHTTSSSSSANKTSPIKASGTSKTPPKKKK
jgi:BRCA1-associated protein